MADRHTLTLPGSIPGLLRLCSPTSHGIVFHMDSELPTELPGWRWEPGMWWVVHREAPLEDIRGIVTYPPRDPTAAPYPGAVPDLDHPATAGILLSWLAPVLYDAHPTGDSGAWVLAIADEDGTTVRGDSLGRACYEAAKVIGRWL